MEVQFNDANECLFELLVSEGIAQRVDGTVEVTQPVGDVVKKGFYTDLLFWAETDDHRQYMPRCPAQDECAKDDRDRAQSLSRAVLARVGVAGFRLGLRCRPSPEVDRSDGRVGPTAPST